ncbi:MAG: hypothetical protein LQ337_000934 [Flavoplaca oasis]|nr:MAG: hypothetical protein LQ337_000934 [Flavoplaca oasis]
MSLQIKTICVGNPAGGTITGIISLHLTSALEVENLAITLSGRAQTDIDQSTTKTPGCIFQGQKLLFAARKTLINQSTTISGSCTWQFKFRIPARCTAREARTFRPFDRFDPNPNQQLPPAFASSYLKADGTHAATAAIIYELRASLSAKGTRLQVVEPVHFISTRTVEHPYLGESAAQAEVAIKSARLESRNSLHLRRTIQSTFFSSKNLPFAALGLVLRGSNQAIIGQSFPLHLGIRHLDDSGSGTCVKPVVYLQELTINLRAHNSIRCTGSRCFKQNGCSSIHKGDEFEDWDEDFLLESCDLTKPESRSGTDERRRKRSFISGRISKSKGIEIPIADAESVPAGLDLQYHTTVPSYLVPSFKSHIISRSYTLETTVVVKCADQAFPITFVSRDFGLLAQDFARKGDDFASIDSERTSGTVWSEESDGLVKRKLLPYT